MKNPAISNLEPSGAAVLPANDVLDVQLAKQIKTKVIKRIKKKEGDQAQVAAR